jgi:hypothetical protein
MKLDLVGTAILVPEALSSARRQKLEKRSDDL